MTINTRYRIVKQCIFNLDQTRTAKLKSTQNLAKQTVDQLLLLMTDSAIEETLVLARELGLEEVVQEALERLNLKINSSKQEKSHELESSESSIESVTEI
jgi:hypothetical protein